MKKSIQKAMAIFLMVIFVALVATACGGNNSSNGNSGNSGNNSGSSSGETQGDSGGSGNGKKTEILFWSPFSGADGPFMKKIVDKYNVHMSEQ